MLNKKKKYVKEIIDIDIRNAIVSAQLDYYIIVKLSKKENVFIDSNDKFHQVKGIAQELGDILEEWEIINTATMQYRGYVICDGMIRRQHVIIGPHLRGEIMAKYAKIKIRIAQQGVAPEPALYVKKK